MSQSSLFGLFMLLVALAVLRWTFSAKARPSMNLTQPVDEDGKPIAFDDLDDVDQWFVEEVHQRRVANGGHMRCDRCKKIVIEAEGDQRVRLFCDPQTDRICCESCVTPEELGQPEDEPAAAEPGQRRLRLVK